MYFFIFTECWAPGEAEVQARPAAVHRAERGGGCRLRAGHPHPQQAAGQGPGPGNGAGAADRAARARRNGRLQPHEVSRIQ